MNDKSFLAPVETASFCCKDLLPLMSIVVYIFTILICDCTKSTTAAVPYHEFMMVLWSEESSYFRNTRERIIGRNMIRPMKTVEAEIVIQAMAK